jgi:hypothetical protein
MIIVLSSSDFSPSIDRSELVQQVREQAHVVAVDLWNSFTPRLSRRGATPGGRACRSRSRDTSRDEASRPILNEKTRVISAAKASAWMSNISCTCSANESGTPAGALGELAHLARRVARLDALDAALDLANVLEVAVQARRSLGAKHALQRRHLARDEVQDRLGASGGAWRAPRSSRPRQRASRTPRAGRE